MSPSHCPVFKNISRIKTIFSLRISTRKKFQKKNSIGPLISASPYHLQLCCHTVQCFQICTRLHSTCGQEKQNFFHPKQFVHQCLGFSHLKRKTTKKNDKNKQTIPLFLQLLCS